MKLFNKIRNIVKRLPGRTVATIAGLTLLVSAPLVARTFAEFYPDRPTYDYNKPCNPNDSDPYDSCGSLTGPVFNSFINTPIYGDERAFLDARRSDQNAVGSYKNVLSDVTGGSKEVVVRMYVHNNANKDATNGTAVGTRVKILLPTGTAKALRARGYIGAQNAAVVEDTVDFAANDAFSLDYVEGSAVLYDMDNFQNGVKLGDDIITENGAAIGSDALDGKFKGCFEYEAVVEIRVKVNPKQVPNIEFKKQNGLPGKGTWGESVTVKPGETISWLIPFKNIGQTDLTKVNVNDKLPPHLTVVPGSVKWTYLGTNGQSQVVPMNDTQLFTTGGFDFGTWKPNGGFHINFQTTAKDDFEGCEVFIRNIAYNDTDQTGGIDDHADVKIVKDNCEVTTPTYRCVSINQTFLRKGADGKLVYQFSTTTAVTGGATVKEYNYEIKGNGGYVFNHKTNATNGQFEHTFPGPDTYTITSTVTFNVPGQGEKTHTSDACKTSITVPKEEEKCPTPGKEHLPKGHPDCDKKCPSNPSLPFGHPDCDKKVTPPPTELPKTGAGDLIGIFVATTVAGTLVHYYILGRRYQ